MGSPTRHLFFTDWEIESLGGARRRWHSLQKQPEPILQPREPWEGRVIYAYGGSLLDDLSGRGCRLYYTAFGRKLGDPSHVCLATSADGLHFERPRLGNFEFEGDTNNNIVYQFPDHMIAATSVVWDGTDTDVRRRMKMIFTVEGETPYDCMIQAACSQDGRKFATVPVGPISPIRSDTSNNLVRNPVDGSWVIFCRPGFIDRRIARIIAEQFEGPYSQPQLILEPDAEDGPQVQFYGMPVILYEGWWLGFLMRYTTEEQDLKQSKMRGRIEMELAFSRNGWAWHRVPGRPLLLPRGPAGSWDSGMVWCTQGIVTLPDDRLLMAYTGTHCNHGEGGENYTAGIGAATLRRDGFVGLASGGDEEVEILTKILTGEPRSKLWVNASVGSGGFLTCEVTDPDGKALPGSAINDCVPLREDCTAHRLQWHSSDCRTWPDAIRLRFRMKRAEIFSFWFKLEPIPPFGKKGNER